MLASLRVTSERRLAARPVGAARMIRFPRNSKTALIDLISVVLPVPGPPVIIMTLWKRASWRTFNCSEEGLIASFFTTSAVICFESIPGGVTGTERMAFILFEIPFSASCRSFRQERLRHLRPFPVLSQKDCRIVSESLLHRKKCAPRPRTAR